MGNICSSENPSGDSNAPSGNQLVIEQTSGAPEETSAAPVVKEVDQLEVASTCIYDDKAMKETLPADVYTRFKDNLITGAPTSEDDMKAIAEALFKWSRERGAVAFAHWFFPMRGGSGAVGGQVGACKYDTMLDLDWSSKEATKPFSATLPYERLFFGETDGSSFPNGDLRATHTAAAFTTWDRSSPCFVHDKVLRIPCAFVTHLGDCIDDKTPLLRSCDAVNKEGLRLLKAIGIGMDAKQVNSFLGWEQEFFVIPAKYYRARPDLVNCGRTLIGKLPTRNQQGDLNYFAAPPGTVDKLMSNIQGVMLKLGVAMAVMHNEVAPGQHEMSPIYCQATFSCDNNVLFMEVANAEAAKLGLAVLFHEKPFQGINGSGKHNNWSCGTDTGLNFFYPGKTQESGILYTTALACLSYGLKQYNEMVRVSVAGAGNDFRLGAQEAPPAIISLYPGTGFEKHVDAIIAGAALDDYKAEKSSANPGATSAMAAPCGVEDRNRTAPFPFCGNRFEFRAVGSSQNCSFPITVCNTIMAAGMAALAAKVEGGMSHRDAVAALFKENRHVIFTGNGYSAEWPIEAKKRGLPNLNTTPLAVAEFATAKNKRVFEELGIFSANECEARQAVMFENYNTTVKIEADTLLHMIETGIIPACANDYTKFVEEGLMDFLGDDRSETYKGIKAESDKLRELLAKVPHGDLPQEAEYFCNTVKPQMVAIREVVDKAEGLMEQGLYPYPTYEQMLYEHHS
jgi:glutamine synthetase